MTAARLHEYHQPLILEELPDAQITASLDALVRIGAAGLCRTDLHFREGQFGAGQKEVNLDRHITCGLCRACCDSDDVHCDNAGFPGLFGVGLAQYLKTGARSVIEIDESVEPTDVAPFADAGLMAYHAIKKGLPLLYPAGRAW